MILHSSSCRTYLHLTVDYTACWWNLKCPTHCGNVVTPHCWYHRKLLVTNKNNAHCYTWRLHLVSFTKLHVKNCNAFLNNYVHNIYPHKHVIWSCSCCAIYMMQIGVLHYTSQQVIVLQMSTQGHRMCGMHICKLLQNIKWGMNITAWCICDLLYQYVGCNISQSHCLTTVMISGITVHLKQFPLRKLKVGFIQTMISLTTIPTIMKASYKRNFGTQFRKPRWNDTIF